MNCHADTNEVQRRRWCHLFFILENNQILYVCTITKAEKRKKIHYKSIHNINFNAIIQESLQNAVKLLQIREFYLIMKAN